MKEVNLFANLCVVIQQIIQISYDCCIQVQVDVKKDEEGTFLLFIIIHIFTVVN